MSVSEADVYKAEGVFMSDFSINEMQEMQKLLQDKYKNKWEPICPDTGKNKLLWRLGEVGEVIDIIKKNDIEKVVHETEVRKELVEELADVLMYYNDVMLCYGISADELKTAYTEKFKKIWNDGKIKTLRENNSRRVIFAKKKRC